MELPADLRSALERELRAIPAKQLAGSADSLSQRYRAGHARSAERYVRTEAEALAYAAYRMPATFAAFAAAFEAAGLRQPAWQPASHLDAGAGPGTAMWAAQSIWPAIGRWTLLEREPAMAAVGARLARHALAPAPRQAEWRPVDLLGEWRAPAHSLVTAGYLLGELPPERVGPLVDRLWAHAADLLILVEPGTPRGFELIRAARERLLAAGAAMVAPCPHARACPLGAGDWCHFSQRIGRTKLQRAVKQADLGFEDEKFAYVAVSRHPAAPIAARVLRHPRVEPGRISLELCATDGLRAQQIVKRQRDAFRRARDLRWGGAIEPGEEPGGG